MAHEFIGSTDGRLKMTDMDAAENRHDDTIFPYLVIYSTIFFFIHASITLISGANQ